MKKLLLAMILILSLSIPCLADVTITLVWTGNTEADLAGYTLYRAERIGDISTAWEKVKTIPKDAVTCTDVVEDGKNFAWMITAFDITGYESFVSNMVELYDRTPPFIVQDLRKE